MQDKPDEENSPSNRSLNGLELSCVLASGNAKSRRLGEAFQQKPGGKDLGREPEQARAVSSAWGPAGEETGYGISFDTRGCIVSCSRVLLNRPQ